MRTREIFSFEVVCCKMMVLLGTSLRCQRFWWWLLNWQEQFEFGR